LKQFNKKMISLSDPILGEEEKKALCEVIDSNWLTMGEQVKAFECEFAQMHGMGSAVAVNSCTAGLHLCLQALGIGPGDEVLVPSLTFVATANSVIYTGATPIFVDIESLAKPHISIEDARAKCTEKTRAVIIMHYGGYLDDLARWRKFTDDQGLKLIEDAAHSPGVQGVGKLSDASAFSFFSNKNMTTAEGGMVFAIDEKVLAKIRHLRSHGMTTNTLERHRGHAHTYDVTMLGFNYRMDELRASMGLVQLKYLLEWNQKRKVLVDQYRTYFNKVLPDLLIPFADNYKSSYHLMPVLLPENVNKIALMQQLREGGIQTSIHYPPVHMFSYYQKRYKKEKLLKTENFYQRELTLPLYPVLKNRDVERIVNTLKKLLQN